MHHQLHACYNTEWCLLLSIANGQILLLIHWAGLQGLWAHKGGVSTTEARFSHSHCMQAEEHQIKFICAAIIIFAVLKSIMNTKNLKKELPQKCHDEKINQEIKPCLYDRWGLGLHTYKYQWKWDWFPVAMLGLTQTLELNLEYQWTEKNEAMLTVLTQECLWHHLYKKGTCACVTSNEWMSVCVRITLPLVTFHCPRADRAGCRHSRKEGTTVARAPWTASRKWR